LTGWGKGVGLVTGPGSERVARRQVEQHGKGVVQEIVCRWLVVGFADDSPEGWRAQGDRD
jgi:hypothetical protein